MSTECHMLSDYKYIYDHYGPDIKIKSGDYILVFEEDKVIVEHKIIKDNEVKYEKIETFTTVEGLLDCICESISWQDDSEIESLSIKLHNILEDNVLPISNS